MERIADIPSSRRRRWMCKSVGIWIRTCNLSLISTKKVPTSFGNMRNIIVFEVQDALGVLNNGGWVRSKEILNRLRHAIVAQESARLCSVNLGVHGVHRGKEVVLVLSHCTALFSICQSWNVMSSHVLTFVRCFPSTKLNVHKVNLQLLRGFHTDKQRGTATRCNDLVGVMLALQDDGESTFLEKIVSP